MKILRCRESRDARLSLRIAQIAQKQLRATSFRGTTNHAIMGWRYHMSLTIKVPIPDELVPVLERRARSAGLERDEYVGAIVSRELNAPQTLDEVLAPFRDQVSASGITDSELDELFRTARNETFPRGHV